MESHERNLVICLCLGVELSGSESDTELELLLGQATEAAELQIPVPLQEEIADWLGLGVDDCHSRREASVRLWNSIERRGYSLVDVPATIRRAAFGGNLNLQKRAGRSPWFSRLHQSARRVAINLAVIAALIALAWVLGKRLLP